MTNLTKSLLYHGGHIERQNMLWNIAGSFCYAMASMVLAFFVMHMAGRDDGGIFSFGFSTLGQQFFIVAYFGIRPFQITDGRGAYSFGDYLSHRMLTCAAAVAGGVLFLSLASLRGIYSVHKSLILLLLIGYKVIDGFADVYESEFQRQGSLYLTGKSNFFRTLLSVGVFLLTLAACGQVLFACLAAVAAQAAGLFLFNLDVIHALAGVDFRRTPGAVRRLFGDTGFLFVSVFLDFYIFSSAKYAIDAQMSDADSGYFNLIFMPTSVIYMVANFIIRPFLTRLTALWEERRLADFGRELRRLGALIGGLTVFAVGATLLLGGFVLSVMELMLGAGYAGTLTPYRLPFAVIVLGGGFYALANLMYYALVIMRRQKAIFFVYAVTAAAALFLSTVLVGRWGIFGAALCYVMLMAGLTLGFGLWTAHVYSREKKETR